MVQLTAKNVLGGTSRRSNYTEGRTIPSSVKRGLSNHEATLGLSASSCQCLSQPQPFGSSQENQESIGARVPLFLAVS